MVLYWQNINYENIKSYSVEKRNRYSSGKTNVVQNIAFFLLNCRFNN